MRSDAFFIKSSHCYLMRMYNESNELDSQIIPYIERERGLKGGREGGEKGVEKGR